MRVCVWWGIGRRHAGQQQFAEVAEQQQYSFSWSLCSSLWLECVCVRAFLLLSNRIYPFWLKT